MICAAISWSTSILIAKKLTERDTILSITFWQAMGCVPLAFAASLFVWALPTSEQLLYLLGIASLGTLGHALLYASLKIGKVSVILPLDYIRIIWSALLGFLLFNHLPTAHMYAGSLLIICATAFISYRELRKNPYRLSSSRFFDRFTTLAIRLEKESELYRKFNTRKPKTNIREQSFLSFFQNTRLSIKHIIRGQTDYTTKHFVNRILSQ